MDASGFDQLARTLATPGTRRGLLRLLAPVPLLGALAALEGVDPAAGEPNDPERGGSHRRRKRKKRHDPGGDKDNRTGKRKGKEKGKNKAQPLSPPPTGCTLEATAKTCAGKCGQVPNNCGAIINCGPCPCDPPCPVCLTCNATTLTCVPDAAQNGAVCAGSGTAASVCCNGTCCSGCCGADGSCGTCLVFLTSTTQTGNLGGLGGADGICQSLAGAANRPGIYMAWLSDATASPSTRFRCTDATCSQQGYTLVNGTPIAGDWDALTDGNLDAAISVTETGGGRTFTVSWTHTLTDGSAGGAGPANAHCNSWSFTDPGTLRGDTGRNDLSDPRWTVNADGPCSGLAHLYCFQQS